MRELLESWPTFEQVHGVDSSFRCSFAKIYADGQRSLLAEAVDCIESLSEADATHSVKRFGANSRFLDRIQSCSTDAGDGRPVTATNAVTNDTVRSGCCLHVRLSLHAVADENDACAVGKTPEEDQMLQALFRLASAAETSAQQETTNGCQNNAPESKTVGDIADMPKVLSNERSESCTTAAAKDSDAVDVTPPIAQEIDVWVEFDPSYMMAAPCKPLRVRVKNAQGKVLIEILKMAYVFFSRKVGEAKLPLSGLSGFHLELGPAGGDVPVGHQASDITDLSRTVRECGLHPGATLLLRTNT